MSETPETTQPNRFGWLIEAAIVASLFIGYSLVQSPVPGVNEPHYLTKAKHFWQPDWCERDLFLQSDNTHLAFYVTLGALTQVVSLKQAAVAGRVLSLLILAAGWTTLLRTVVFKSGGAVLAAVVYLLLHTLGNWSGEWLVGGVESKVPAYGLAFFAVACWIDRRIRLAGLAAGLAVTMHPLVGGWTVVALAMAIVWGFLRDRERSSVTPKDWVIGGALFTLAALPGLVPALSMLAASDPEQSAAAARVQVLERLSHHLNPRDFSRSNYRLFGLLLIGWYLGRGSNLSAGFRKWERFTVASLVIAAAGVAVAIGTTPLQDMTAADLRIGVLKFYLFRLADITVPMTVAALAASRLLDAAVPTRAAALLAAGLLAFTVPGIGRDAGRMPPDQFERWVDVCSYLKQNTPPEALCLVYSQSESLKWHAGRPEYWNYKDMPQDAESLLEWQRRRGVAADWLLKWRSRRGFTQDALDALHEQTGIDYVIAPSRYPFAVSPLRRNVYFQIIPTQPDNR